jgi:6-pyruvoyltetrahydropterin/6-carboxytetrahydropterin synthase
MWIYGLWFDRLPELTAVKVSETPKTWAVYRPQPSRGDRMPGDGHTVYVD